MTELPIDENTPRILIVEDEPKLGQLLIDYLRAASYAPTLISHGDQVLPYVRQTPPDLILLDLMLPGTDGDGKNRRDRSPAGAGDWRR